MKICIYGAGAIGGYLGAELALAGEEVTLIARGPHLAAMRENGLTLLIEGERKVARVACTDDPGDVGPQDYVFLTLKAHATAGIASRVVPLLGPETAIVTAQNGVPWWYFHKLAGPWEGRRIESVDAGGTISDALPPERAIGCIVYPSCEVGRAGRHPARGGQTVHARGAGRLVVGPGRRAERDAGARGFQAPGTPAYP